MTPEKTILLCTIGSAGDVNPFIGIGQQLKKRGFRVVLITSQYFESQARSAVSTRFINSLSNACCKITKYLF